MDTASAVALACDHQSTIVHVLAWAGGTMPVASILAWATARWNKVPPGLQTIIQLVAGNFAHAVMGEPQPPQPVPVPVPVPVPGPAEPAPMPPAA